MTITTEEIKKVKCEDEESDDINEKEDDEDLGASDDDADKDDPENFGDEIIG